MPKTQAEALAEELSIYAMQFAEPIYFGPPPDKQSDAPINNGTISLILLGTRQVGITNWHVIDEYRKRASENQDLICQISNVRIDPIAQLISESKHFDVAVLDLSNTSAEEIGKGTGMPCQFLAPREWPPAAVSKGDFVLFGGFPGLKRKDPKPGHLDFGSISSGGTKVESIQEDVITCRIQLERCVVNFDEDGLGMGPLPGISGSPVLIHRTISDVSVFDFVGVIFEHSNEWDILRIRPASLLSDNGIIVEHA